MVAVLLNPLRRDHFGSWTDLALAIFRLRGGDLSTLEGLDGILRTGATHRGPPSKRRKRSHAYQANVEALFELRYPFPLPKYQNAFRARITKAKRFKGSPELLDVICDIEELVDDTSCKKPLSAAGLKYLEFLARHARALYNDEKPTFGDANMACTRFG